MNIEKKIKLITGGFHVTDNFDFPFCTLCGLQIRRMSEEASPLNIHTCLVFAKLNVFHYSLHNIELVVFFNKINFKITV